MFQTFYINSSKFNLFVLVGILLGMKSSSSKGGQIDQTPAPTKAFIFLIVDLLIQL